MSGQFDEAGLTDDVTGLANGDYLGLKEWEEFYAKDYKFVGKTIITFEAIEKFFF